MTALVLSGTAACLKPHDAGFSARVVVEETASAYG